MERFYRTTYDSPLGQLTLVGTKTELCGLWLAGQKYFLNRFADVSYMPDKSEALRQTQMWLEQYFAGTEPRIQLSLAPRGTDFQQLVWRLLRQIPYGQTTTYGMLAQQAARLLGKPKMSAQAIGAAVGHNPISIVIPCHRVLATHSQLGGYAGGLERKQWLLDHEIKQR